MKRTWFPLAILALAMSPVTAFSIDYVTRRGDEKRVGGEVKTNTRIEVVVFQKVGNKEEKIPANEVTLVEWDGEPAEFGLARGDEFVGNYTKALERLAECADVAKGGDPSLRADIEFFTARVAAKMAIDDPTLAKDAVAKLKGFVTAHRENFRFYEAQALLAEVALRTKDDPIADSAFNALTQSPWPDTQMSGKIGLARVLLASKNTTGAKAGFDAVVALDAKTPAALARRQQAMIGQARCLQLLTQHAEALKIIEQVVEQADAEETRTLAEAYLLQGDSLVALGQKEKDAVLAYLHVDVIPALAAEGDLHAEALFHLSKLWGTIGQAARGAEASAKLEQLYPNSDWTKKLGGS